MVDVGIHDEHAADFLWFSLELAGAVVGLESHVAHDFAEQGFALVTELGVFHRGAGYLGNRFYPLDMLGPDFGNAASIGIIDAAGAAGTDGDEPGPGRGRFNV